jgi:hypothetical protein
MSSLWSWNGFQNTTYGSIPQPRLFQGTEFPSACNNGFFSSSSAYGYACPHQALLSNDMLGAARYDGLSSHFVYGVAGASTDDDCGKCYQIQLLDAERVWRDDFPFLVVQVINSGYDVMPYQFDVFMGAGGFGYFTACNRDCGSHYCQGGPCAEGMFPTTFEQWTQVAYADPHTCYSGGIKWLEQPEKAKQYCEEALASQEHARDSCVRSNAELFHQNFVEIRAERVQCPPGLYRLTGLQRADDGGLPYPSPTLALTQHCQGDRSQGHFCITTMQDCCKPSCSWRGKGNPSREWDHVDYCDAKGNLYDYVKEMS